MVKWLDDKHLETFRKDLAGLLTAPYSWDSDGELTPPVTFWAAYVAEDLYRRSGITNPASLCPTYDGGLDMEFKAGGKSLLFYVKDYPRSVEYVRRIQESGFVESGSSNDIEELIKMLTWLNES